jgi:hypothetical protein
LFGFGPAARREESGWVDGGFAAKAKPRETKSVHGKPEAIATKTPEPLYRCFVPILNLPGIVVNY